MCRGLHKISILHASELKFLFLQRPKYSHCFLFFNSMFTVHGYLEAGTLLATRYKFQCRNIHCRVKRFMFNINLEIRRVVSEKRICRGEDKTGHKSNLRENVENHVLPGRELPYKQLRVYDYFKARTSMSVFIFKTMFLCKQISRAARADHFSIISSNSQLCFTTGEYSEKFLSCDGEIPKI